MHSVRFFGPLNMHSGYGYAVKNFAQAFSDSSVDTRFVFGEKAEKKYFDFFSSLNNYRGNCDIDFYLHGPPWRKHKSRARYKIGYFYWEADKLPFQWVRGLNFVDEIWAPCELVKSACLKAGFRGRIIVVPTPIEDWHSEERAIIPSSFSQNYIVSGDIFKFYSIFQWHERKGYRELLTSYYRAFNAHDNVLLIVKTNSLNIAGNTKEKIRHDILSLKRRMNLKYYSPVYLIDDIISDEEIKALHMSGDCYVSPHHGEGWGLPIHDAMVAGNQIITTKFGGVTEYLSNDSAHIIRHTMGPVRNMSWSSLYNNKQNWAYPKVSHIRTLMRDIYENKDSYQEKIYNAKRIASSMTINVITERIEKEIGRIKT